MDFLVEYKSAYYSHKSNFVGSLQTCPLTLLTLDDFYSSFVRNPSIVPFSDEKLMPRAITLRLSAA